MSEDPLKLSEVTPLRLSESINRRVVEAASRRSIKRPEWIRQAILAELARDEAAAAARQPITPEQAALLALCTTVQARGIDPRQALTDALEARLTAEAGAPATAPTPAAAA